MNEKHTGILGQTIDGDWEFEVRDLNGYVLVFGGTAK